MADGVRRSMPQSRTGRACVYCSGATGARSSRERVISRSVLVVAFGPEIENVAHSEVFSQKSQLEERSRRLQDMYEHEHLSAEDYRARHAELSAQIRELSLVAEQPTLAERRGDLRSLVQVWPEAATSSSGSSARWAAATSCTGSRRPCCCGRVELLA